MEPTTLDFFAEPILALESSCDETSAAVVQGRQVRSNIVASQAQLHRQWGGVVPEAAARAHIEAIIPVIDRALDDADVGLADIQGIAVTNRPGLVGALSVGLTAAKGLAFARGLPFLGIHHLEGHILSPLARFDVPFPHTCLVVSGGHTELVRVVAPVHYEIVGQTLDDAAGEAFDKGARLLGLGYPGGHAIQEAARGGDPHRYPLPQGLSGDTANFSFSGLKTAMLRLVETEGDAIDVSDAAACLQEAIVGVLAARAVATAIREQSPALTLVGGVAANLALRARLSKLCDQEDIEFFTPDPDLCTDNAAMIGIAASLRFARGERDAFDLDAVANAPLPCML